MTNINPASERQVAFIQSLLAERIYGEVIEFATLTSKQASLFIGELLKAPRNNQPAVLALGMYRMPNGEIYRVHASRETGNLYAKHLDPIEMKFEFEQGAIKRLRPEHRMTLEEAKHFGMQTGFCCVCGKFLTDARSVANGIGPVCEKNV